jgi:hypothetical protein
MHCSIRLTSEAAFTVTANCCYILHSPAANLALSHARALAAVRESSLCSSNT